VETLLTSLGLATAPLPYPLDAVLAALATDKKHESGSLRWVLPGAEGPVVRADVPADLVARIAASLLDGSGVAA
jgi:3-dehydroquinate synthetase